MSVYRSFSPAETRWLSGEAAAAIALLRRGAPFELLEHRVRDVLCATEVGLANLTGGGWLDWALGEHLIWPAPQTEFQTVVAFAIGEDARSTRLVNEYAKVWVKHHTALLQSSWQENTWPGGPPRRPPCNDLVRDHIPADVGILLNDYCSLDALIAAVATDCSYRQWSLFQAWANGRNGRVSRRMLARPMADKPCGSFVRLVMAHDESATLLRSALPRFQLLCRSRIIGKPEADR